jgi:homoserine dehydrogenase
MVDREGRALRIGLLGHGTVGAAFEELLGERAERVAMLTGRRPEITGVLTRSRGDFEEILAGCDLVVELIGGVEDALRYVRGALESGRDVVTANKQLLSRHGEELWELARARERSIGFEAAVAGVVPAIRVLRDSLAGTRIERVHGIVNGTTNYILSEMTRTSCSYDVALAEAQRLGYAEADPSDDVGGADAAAKMAILARLAFDAPVRLRDVRFEGIEQITPDDIAYARELGLALKLVGTAERIDGGISVRVHPAFLYAGHPLASVGGSFNAVTVEAPAITEITMSGPGAGGTQTASAVLADVIAAAAGTQRPLPEAVAAPIVEDVTSAFYLHMRVIDRPGVLARIAQCLGEQGASIKSVVQRGLGEQAQLVMVIHPLPESSLRAAIAAIGEIEAVQARPRAIRVIEEEFE